MNRLLAASAGWPDSAAHRNTPARSRVHADTRTPSNSSAHEPMSASSTPASSPHRVRASDTRSSAFAISADCRSSSNNRAFSTATATCDESASITRRSSASNFPSPSFTTPMVPTTRAPNFRGTTRTDSSTSGVPGTSMANSQRAASGA